MIISLDNFKEILKELNPKKFLSIDTETTGLKWFNNDRLFSLVISDETEDYYFNFNKDPDYEGNLPPSNFILPREWLKELQLKLSDKNCTWFIHNAKFDMGIISREGLIILGEIHCTEAVARLLDGRHPAYTLDDCVRRMFRHLRQKGPSKIDEVKKLVSKKKLYKEVHLEGKNQAKKELHYHKVPFDMMATYACMDGRLCYLLGTYQLKVLENRISKGLDGFKQSYDQEKKITKVCFEMEKEGIDLDIDYTNESLSHYRSNMKDAEQRFYDIAGTHIVDSAKGYKEVFQRLSIVPGLTAKGNPSYAADVLEKVKHPIGKVITDYREARKLMSSYYSTFLYLVSKEGKIHCSIKQNGASKTQRMSIVDPALQTVPKEHDPNDPWNVRRCFVPPEDYCFFAPDYDQMEYRMMLDQAEEIPVIKKILGGLDVHTATAEQMKASSRDAAKTINFLLLYGGGPPRLAEALGISVKEAESLYHQYFYNLSNVQRWRRKIMAFAQFKGYIKNPMGTISLVHPKGEYKAPNYAIQGGCAQAMKKAMAKIADNMKGMKSKMVLQIHDELLFAMHRSELDYCPEIVEVMESVYKYKYLPLTVGPKFSWRSWGDTKEGYPTLEAA